MQKENLEMGKKRPADFLEIIVHDVSIVPSLTGLCAGYEAGEWRHIAFASHLMEWLPEFALSWADNLTIRDHNALEMLKRAAQVVYETDKYSRRGEFGELLLHAVVRQVFNSIPAISKIYYKSAANDPVKGFDAVHIIATGTELELWLGEAKFYADIKKAIRDVVEELISHTQNDYLREEFALITNKIDDTMPHAAELKSLLHRNTSLDKIFSRTCMPVLLTYNSPTIKEFNQFSAEYIETLKAEFSQHYAEFVDSELSRKLRIHLLLIPLKNKALLVEVLHSKLKALQTI